MELINFDRMFEGYLQDWLKRHAGEYQNMDQVEEIVPEIYESFLNTPSEVLNGQTPLQYFEVIDDPEELVTRLRAYTQQKVPLPDLLLDRIAELGSRSEPVLLALLQDESSTEEHRMLALSLLQEVDSMLPMQYCVEQVAGADREDGLAERCAASLMNMGEAVREPLCAVLPQATEAGRNMIADILAGLLQDERTFSLLMDRFAHAGQKALFASLLSKYQDERALPALRAAAEDPEINYLDYVEIAHAMEALGGERPPEREFSGDIYYESMKQI